MPSRAERRRLAEAALRVAAVAALVAALVRALAASGGEATAVAHARVDGMLAPAARDSLAAHARAGTRVTWSGTVAAVAVSSEPARDAAGRTRIAAVGDGRVGLADSLGPVDSLPPAGGMLVAAGLAGPVRAVSHDAGAPPGAATEARTIARVGATRGRVLVVGRVGWEAKFTIAALEEAGWAVDARLRLADTLAVTQGRPGAPALATHAAVVVLDSAITGDAAAITRFVRGGGGLVLAGDGAAAAAFAPLAPARAGTARPGERDAFERGEPMHGLPFRPLAARRADAVPLERRDDALIVAARRVVAGRVVQSGLVETWRWRMQAERDGPENHRAFWNRLVAAASPTPAESGSSAPEASAGRASGASGASGPSPRSASLPEGAVDAQRTDEAPRAALVHRLGEPTADAPASAPPSSPLSPLFGALVLVLLLAEWASRRARGAA